MSSQRYTPEFKDEAVRVARGAAVGLVNGDRLQRFDSVEKLGAPD